MNIYPELKKIASLNEKRKNLVRKLEDKIDTDDLDIDGLDFARAYFVSGCKEKKGHLYKDGYRLDNGGLVDEDYYCQQYTGYCEDDFYGTLFFKTDVPGQFIAVPFEM